MRRKLDAFRFVATHPAISATVEPSSSAARTRCRSRVLSASRACCFLSLSALSFLFYFG